MIPRIDVVIHNFRPGTMETLNLDFKTLAQLNSRLYMAISGFGTEGPLRRAPPMTPSFRHSAAWRRRKALTNRQLSSARFSATRLPVIPPLPSPVRCSPERTGNGQIIDLSMLDSGLFYVPDASTMRCLTRTPSRRPLIDILYDLTPTKDGGITVAAANQEMQGRSSPLGCCIFCRTNVLTA